MDEFSASMVRVLGKHTATTIFNDAGIGRLIEAYGSLVIETEMGEGIDGRGEFYEFENDLHVRQILEKVITDPDVANYNELQSIVGQVASLDNRMRQTEKSEHFIKYAKAHNFTSIT